jgi:hypothetical protein
MLTMRGASTERGMDRDPTVSRRHGASRSHNQPFHH